MNKNIFIFLVLILFGSSCTKEFLDKPLLAKESSETFFNEQGNVEKGMMAIYNVLRSNEAYAASYWILGSVASDDAEAGGESGGNDISDVQNLDQLIHNSSNAYIGQFWFAMYAGIYRANVLIEGIDNPYLDEGYKKKVRAEALALRALFHFELVKVFGGVPIMDEVKPIDKLAIPRNTIKEVFTQIETDLKEAAISLPAKWSIDNEGRISSGAAKALLVKLYVFESSYAERTGAAFAGCTNRWEDARALAETIITDKANYGFDLEPNFANIWSKSGDLSSENIIKANALRTSVHEDPGISYGEEYWPNGTGTGTAISEWQGCRTFYQKNGTDSLTEDFYQLGWGFNCPTSELFNAYVKGDPRRDIGFIEDKVNGKYQDSVKYFKTNKWIHLSTRSSPTGLACRKYLMDADAYNVDVVANSQCGELDIKIYRYADLLLLAAEANSKVGNVGRATELVNMVRTRARNSGTTGLPVDLASVTYDDILAERRMELACEGHRYFDLVRTGTASSAINGQLNKTVNRTLTFDVGKNEFFPIPSAEVVRSNYVIEQNPGY